MRHILYTLLLLIPYSVSAEQIFTAEIAPYEMRDDAEKRDRQEVQYYAKFNPLSSQDSSYTKSFTLPEKWSGRVITLHVESVGEPYTLTINGVVVLTNTDHITPTDIDISEQLREGENIFKIETIASSPISTASAPSRAKFEGSYLCALPRTRISDFKVALTPDKKIKEARLNISITLRNDFSQEQSVDVGYDIYDPAGKLLDFSVNKFSVEGKTCDTIHFNPIIYGAAQNRWSTDKPKVYKVMLYTRRNDVITEYIPLHISYLDIEYDGRNISNFSEKLNLKIERYNAQESKQESIKDLRALKAKGINTIQTSYPQPSWLYEACQGVGLWVIDQPNINSVHEAENKKIGGTPANDPTLKEEYLRRMKSAYHRSRDFDIVIGYSLAGDESGNGYNLYKAYEWIKGVETLRPIIYRGAQGEWNSDILE